MNFVYWTSTSFLLIILLASLSFAQNPIPNAGFENWTAENPDNWLTYDIPGVYDAVTQSDIAHSGLSAVKGEVVEVFGENVQPFLAPATGYFSIDQNYTRLTGYYQFSSNGEEVFWATVQFLDAQSMFVATGTAEFGETVGGYKQFIVNLDYTFGSGQPATQASISFSIIESQADSINLGSYFLIDDLEFDNASSLSDDSFGEIPRTYQLTQNYPNPFNPSTTINFSIAQSGKVSLIVFNSIGQEVQTLFDKEMTAGEYQVNFNADNLPSGIYFYKLESGSYINVKKMIVLK
jgi:hypothetical protein